ncbi:hypothetical protein VPNG_03577 [Cytospora leucostoma]|uniref:AGC-kinase C-terminal domain-containing protein n=1 Tax=Cytospora leucostoma TaxID=1230097 RepID=A0A423XD04_9PEZI|nr:hypothetical protein VPNG_03577 [Cytospora leucostoma]
MVGNSGHRILSRVRSNRKLRAATAADLEEQKLSPLHRRQHSDNVSASVTGSSSISSPSPDARTHRPPIEWDPLKLNPPTPPVARPRDSVPEYALLRSRRSLAGGGHRPRMHHSDSGFSLEVHEGFDFGFEREKALARMEMGQHGQQQQHHHHHHDDGDDDDVNSKGWPSPTSSVDSDKSWFDHGGDDDDDDDGDQGDEDGAVKRINDLWGGGGGAPSARRRPQVASPDDPNYFIQRGGWKRRGIVFGGTADQVRQKDEEVFNII